MEHIGLNLYIVSRSSSSYWMQSNPEKLSSRLGGVNHSFKNHPFIHVSNESLMVISDGYVQNIFESSLPDSIMGSMGYMFNGKEVDILEILSRSDNNSLLGTVKRIDDVILSDYSFTNNVLKAFPGVKPYIL